MLAPLTCIFLCGRRFRLSLMKSPLGTTALLWGRRFRLPIPEAGLADWLSSACQHNAPNRASHSDATLYVTAAIAK